MRRDPTVQMLQARKALWAEGLRYPSAYRKDHEEDEEVAPNLPEEARLRQRAKPLTMPAVAGKPRTVWGLAEVA